MADQGTLPSGEIKPPGGTPSNVPDVQPPVKPDPELQPGIVGSVPCESLFNIGDCLSQHLDCKWLDGQCVKSCTNPAMAAADSGCTERSDRFSALGNGSYICVERTPCDELFEKNECEEYTNVMDCVWSADGICEQDCKAAGHCP